MVGTENARDRARSIEHILNLIPAKILLDQPEKEEGHEFWKPRAEQKKRKAPSAAVRKAEQQAKRARVDPAKFKTTVQLIQEAAQKEQKKHGRQPKKLPAMKPKQNLSPDELRQKLRAKITAMREEKAKEQSVLDKAAKEGGAVAPTEPKAPKKEKKQKNAPVEASDEFKIAEDIDFGDLNFAAKKSDAPFETWQNKPGTKAKRMAKELAKAQALKETNAQGGEKKMSLALERALDRARGKKTHDDAGRIKKAMKNVHKKKQKGAVKWEERNTAVANAKAAKQATRTENIDSYRKKKSRAGFEGKKQDFLNSNQEE